MLSGCDEDTNHEEINNCVKIYDYELFEEGYLLNKTCDCYAENNKTYNFNHDELMRYEDKIAMAKLDDTWFCLCESYVEINKYHFKENTCHEYSKKKISKHIEIKRTEERLKW